MRTRMADSDWEQLGFRPEEWPNAVAIGRSGLSLPLAPHLTDADMEDLISEMRQPRRILNPRQWQPQLLHPPGQ